MSARIAGRRALVTGATGGLGDALVRRLTADGAHVIATGRRQDALDALTSSRRNRRPREWSQGISNPCVRGV